MDSGSSQVGRGGRGRFAPQPVSSYWSDCRHGGHLHEPRYEKGPGSFTSLKVPPYYSTLCYYSDVVTRK